MERLSAIVVSGRSSSVRYSPVTRSFIFTSIGVPAGGSVKYSLAILIGSPVCGLMSTISTSCGSICLLHATSTPAAHANKHVNVMPRAINLKICLDVFIAPPMPDRNDAALPQAHHTTFSIVMQSPPPKPAPLPLLLVSPLCSETIAVSLIFARRFLFAAAQANLKPALPRAFCL